MPTLKKLKRTMSSSEYGGAVLLGIKGVVIICHGELDAEAIKNAIGVAKSRVERNLVEMIKKVWKDIAKKSRTGWIAWRKD